MALKVLTGLVLALVCVPIVVFARLSDAPPIVGWVMVGVPLTLTVACALFTVRGYVLDGHTLWIQRLIWQTPLSLVGLRDAEYDPAAMSWSLRLFGNGGFFSFSGWYRSRTLGIYRAWVMDPKRSVVLRFDRRVVVISPDRPAHFVAVVKEAFGIR
jgi:hypothetical protein